MPVESRQAIDYMIETLEILEIAISARDKDKAFEAVTVFLLQFLNAFQSDADAFENTFPLLEQLKDRIQSENYSEALRAIGAGPLLCAEAPTRATSGRQAGPATSST